MLKYMLIKHKQIFECFNCFWKVFILKIFKNFKNCATLFWRLASWIKPVACLSREFIQKVFTTHWQVKVLVAKKTQKFFQKSGFLDLSRLSLVTCSQVEAPVARFTQNVSRLPSRLSRGWNFQSRKTLRQILPIFVSRLLATSYGDLFAKVFATHWQVKVPVAKKTQKSFQKSRFLDFSQLSLATCSQMEALIARFTQNVSRLLLRLSHGSRKTLRQILPIFVSRLLATCL